MCLLDVFAKQGLYPKVFWEIVRGNGIRTLESHSGFFTYLGLTRSSKYWKVFGDSSLMLELLWALQPSAFQVKAGLHLAFREVYRGICAKYTQGGHHAHDTDVENSGGRAMWTLDHGWKMLRNNVDFSIDGKQGRVLCKLLHTSHPYMRASAQFP